MVDHKYNAPHQHNLRIPLDDTRDLVPKETEDFHSHIPHRAHQQARFDSQLKRLT